MPSSRDILAGLARLSHDWLLAAILWHAVGALVFIAVVQRFWRPTRRSAALLAATPVFSAAVFAWIGRNPFNGVVLSGLAVALACFALRFDRSALRFGSAVERTLGAVLMSFGFVYPHFVDASSPWLYLFASPLGLIPCPSLSMLIGVGLFCDAFGSRAWGLTAAGVGAFYGIVGVARLGVWIDLVLLVGAAALALHSAGTLRARTAPFRT